MQEATFNPRTTHPLEIYLEHLSLINGTRLTQREIDVIACLLSGRNRKGIANFLSISTKTVDTHINNSTSKFACNINTMITLLQSSNHFLILKEYYMALRVDNLFKKILKEIAALSTSSNVILNCVIVYWKGTNHFVKQLEKDLKCAGLKVFLEDRRDIQSCSQLIQEVEHDGCRIYFLPNALIGKRQSHKISDLPSSKIYPEIEKISNSVIFFLPKSDKPTVIPEEFSQFTCVNAGELPGYYFSVFIILKKILPTLTLEDIFARFEEKVDALCKMPLYLSYENSKKESLEKKNKEEFYKHYIKKIIATKKKTYALISCIFFMGLIFLFILIFHRGNIIKNSGLKDGKFSYKSLSTAQEGLGSQSIRSDLLIPAENSLLNRSYIIAQIDSSFKKQEQEIQTVALVGIGGSGKTTLARQYAHQQKANIIWEINAETKESLKGSFESLAQALAIREEDKKLLHKIENIKNISKREEKIIHFVKRFLRSHSNWVLIFDNVEKFSEIQKYFPQDFATWGQGKIILTTRDSNIENNSFVNAIIRIKELSSSQKLTLFKKIRDHEKKHPLAPFQIEKIKMFLENIPPFPLDVSIAAYYLKSTNVTYEKYLENLKHYNEEFMSVQENLLKESGNYNKTRYGIIALSVEHIIASHKDFRDLLLFISFLDSQDIPRDLLDKFKSSTVVDNFIYTLKRHSLITDGFLQNLPVLSMHRSIQMITLSYLRKVLNLEKNKNNIGNIVEKITDYMSVIIDRRDLHKNNLIIRNCNALLDRSDLLKNFDVASINSILGISYMYNGNYNKAEKILKKSIIIYREKFYTSHIWYARALAYLGHIYREKGLYDKATQLLEESILVYEKNSYKNHPFYSRVLSCLGCVYREQGNYEKAKRLLEEALVIYNKNPYQNSLWIAQDLASLGSVYREQGNYEKAKKLLEESLAIYKKNSYEDVSFRALVCLGNVYRDMGYYEKAKQLLEKIVATYRKHSYQDLPWFAWTLACLGNVYRDLGNYEKARELLEEAIANYRRNSYNNLPQFCRSLTYLGNVYKEQGNYEKAKQLFEESIAIYKKNSYENHPWFGWTLTCLENIYRDREIAVSRGRQTVKLKSR